MDIHQMILFGGLGIVTACFIRVALWGRFVHSIWQGAQDFPHARVKEMPSTRAHHRAARTALGALGLYIVLIEIMVRLYGGTHINTLFIVHLLFGASLLTGIILLNFPMNGLRSSRHGLLAYTTICCLIGTLATGIPLILLYF